jgi:hypothetical protein
MTPSIAIVHVQNPHWRGIKLWIPLFLLWIPALILSPLFLVVLLAVSIVGRIDFVAALKTFWGILCGLSGTDVRVNADGNRVLVRIL